ncbi:oligosaccharide flippase family protein [Alteromonadaceae bacterium BrNp21-10]|nr:oligosaccharide flippase family protein [Alteromonadaceae bacterium BrNp21-10]
MSLLLSASKGLGWNTLGTILRGVMGLAQLALLSRYLDASELGTYSQFFIVTTIALMLAEFGLTAAAISQRDLSEDQTEQLGLSYLLNGIVISLLLIFFAPLFSLIFKNPNLVDLIILYSPAIFIVAVGQYSAMECQKSLNFLTLIKAETAGVVIGFFVLSLGLINGMGVYAFVLGIVANMLTKTLILLCIVQKVYLKLWRFKFKGALYFFSYGSKFTASNLLSLLVTSSDIIFISRFVGLEQTGQYGLIKDLVFRITVMINPILTRVALPFYGKLQSHPTLGEIYCLVKELLCYLTVPIYSFFIIFPELSIVLLLGEKWIQLSGLLQILSGWMIIRSVISQSGSLLAAVGRVKQSLNWNVAVALIFPTTIYISAPHGIVAVAWTLFCLQVFLYIPHWFWLLRTAAVIPLYNYTLALFRPLAASHLTLFLVSLLVSTFTWHIYLKFSLILVLASIIYGVLVIKRIMTIYKSLKMMELKDQ